MHETQMIQFPPILHPFPHFKHLPLETLGIVYVTNSERIEICKF